MAIDTYVKEQERLAEEARVKAGIPKPVEDKLTLKDIMHDERQNALLGDMISHQGNISDKEIMERLATGKMEAGDIDRLAEIRTEFAEKMRKAETIQSEITPELIQLISKNNPDLKKIVELGSTDGVKKAVYEMIKKIAVTDPSTFDQIVRQVETVKSYREGDYKRLDDEIIKKCKDNNWNADAYTSAIAITDPIERQKAMVKVVKAGWEAGGVVGSIDKAINFLSFGNLAKQAAIDGVGWDDIRINNMLATLASHKDDLGRVLAGSIAGNSDLLAAISNEIVGVPKKKESAGMSDVKNEMPTDEYVQEEWIKHKKKLRGWRNWDPADQDLERGYFMDDLKDAKKKKVTGKGGFWAALFGGKYLVDFFTNFDKFSLPE